MLSLTYPLFQFENKVLFSGGSTNQLAADDIQVILKLFNNLVQAQSQQHPN